MADHRLACSFIIVNLLYHFLSFYYFQLYLMVFSFLLLITVLIMNHKFAKFYFFFEMKLTTVFNDPFIRLINGPLQLEK